MRKDSFWYGEDGENKIIHKGDIKMQAIDTKRVLIIKAEKEERFS